MLKTAIAIRHIGFEDLGYFEAPLIRAGYRIHEVDAGTAATWPVDPRAADLLILLGGPMGVYEEDRHPFLAEERAIVADRVAAGRPVLGICLGAQLIAAALGARVYPGPVKEIGFAPVSLTEAGAHSPLAAIAAEQPVLHWHGDTFDLPEGATRLASTPLTPIRPLRSAHRCSRCSSTSRRVTASSAGCAAMPPNSARPQSM